VEVSNDFSFDTNAVLASEERVEWIFVGEIRARGGGALVGF
jgi:hypothetical protein